MQIYEPGIILEFDSLKDLQDFDYNYYDNCPSKIFDHITKELNTTVREISDIETIKGNQESIGFTFVTKQRKYKYSYEKALTDEALEEVFI